MPLISLFQPMFALGGCTMVYCNVQSFQSKKAPNHTTLNCSFLRLPLLVEWRFAIFCWWGVKFIFKAFECKVSPLLQNFLWYNKVIPNNDFSGGREGEHFYSSLSHSRRHSWFLHKPLVVGCIFVHGKSETDCVKQGKRPAVRLLTSRCLDTPYI